LRGFGLKRSGRRFGRWSRWPGLVVASIEAAGNVERPTSNVQHRTSNIEHRTSNIEHRTSNIEHRTSNVERRTSNIEHRTSVASDGEAGKVSSRSVRVLDNGRRLGRTCGVALGGRMPPARGHRCPDGKRRRRQGRKRRDEVAAEWLAGGSALAAGLAPQVERKAAEATGAAYTPRPKSRRWVAKPGKPSSRSDRVVDGGRRRGTGIRCGATGHVGGQQ
jgi:hypothetical protein